MLPLSPRPFVHVSFSSFVRVSKHLPFKCFVVNMSSLLPSIEVCSDLNKSQDFDGVVVIADAVKSVGSEHLRKALSAVSNVDAKAESSIFVTPAPPELKGLKRIIFSGTGPIDRDYDDVRSIGRAASKGVARALGAGCRAPLLVTSDFSERFPEASKVSLLGALEAVYVPLEMREQVKAKATKVDRLGVLVDSEKAPYVDEVKALEKGRIVCRDIGGSDPERMAPPKVQEYVESTFKDDPLVSIEVVSGTDTLEKEYPCFAAVNRAASVIPRHEGRVIWLTYEPEDKSKVEKTLFVVGKGVTYDTGGADIKAGGIMAGMSRDKCGAASAAGIVAAVSAAKSSNIKVVAALCMVRNSVGENSYVADEIITSRAGVRIRVGNTDAEGRMAMVDPLCHAREKALSAKDPHLLTIATLTGHEVLSYGPYSAVMDNGPAKPFAQKLAAVGETFGDVFEVSTMRKEDFDFVKDASGEFVDVLQCNNAASSRTPRGHQFPGAFLQVVSGLDQHMIKSEKPLKYSHLDIAGSSGELPGITTGASVIAVVKKTT